MNDTILEIKDLHVLFPVHKKWLPAVDGVNLKIEKGEITGVVGESGSGKSVMSQTILRLRDHDTNVRYEGEILFEGEDLLKQPLNKIRDIRGDRISVIFQDPLTSLSPVHTVGSQLSEVLTLHKGLNKEQAKEKAIEMLKLTGIPNPENCFKQYPYELSGGMQQRVMIAMALSCEPKLLIADEPTTALDVTIQEQILQLIRELNEKLGMSVLFITHDMGAVANLCHNVKVMYLGQVVEEASTEELFQNPQRKEAARLTGCKNFTRAVYVDEHTAELTDWGITLHTEQRNIPENTNYIGYRAHDFVPVWGEGGKNQIPFLLESKAALPFEDNYYLKPANEEADPPVISWFVQRENQEKILEKGLPDALELVEEEVLFLE